MMEILQILAIDAQNVLEPSLRNLHSRLSSQVALLEIAAITVKFAISITITRDVNLFTGSCLLNDRANFKALSVKKQVTGEL